MSNDKKHGLGRGISSLLGGDFSFDESVENIISKNSTPVPVEMPATSVTKKADKPRKAKKDTAAVPSELDENISAEDRITAVYVSIDTVSPNPNQPRKAFNKDLLDELAESIKSQGIIQPLIVEEIVPGKYSIIAGERRFRAAQIAGLEKLPVIIKKPSELDRIQMSLIENLQREDLSPVEEALGYKALIDEHGFSQEEVAKSVGKSRPAVANALRLLKLPDNIMEYLKDGKISAGHARALLTLENEELMTELADEIVAKDLSVRQVEKICKKKPTVQKEEKPEKKPSFYSMVELALSESLGRKISVSKSKGKQGGVLQIEFYSDEELTELSNKLK